MQKLKRASLLVMSLFYIAGGINHFRSRQSYLRIIPHYFPNPILINILAGGFELLFGVAILFKKTRRPALFGIILMLIAFLPVHIKMIRDAPLQLGDLTITPFIAWVRLVVLQPLLILWAGWYYKLKAKN